MIPGERLDSLRAKHAELEAEIDVEVHRPHPDDGRLVELKKAKLRVKDKIEGIR